MPSLSDALSASLEHYVPLAGAGGPSIIAATKSPQPERNPFMRCPLPQIWVSNSDSLRQTFTTAVPQRRLVLPK